MFVFRTGVTSEPNPTVWVQNVVLNMVNRLTLLGRSIKMFNGAGTSGKNPAELSVLYTSICWPNWDLRPSKMFKY